MKKLWIASVVIGIAMVGCSSEQKNTETTEAAMPAKPMPSSNVYKVDTGKSELVWMGAKVAYGHEGTVEITEGELTLKDGMIESGMFVIDMNTIEEVGQEDQEKAQKLVGHLKSPDFFEVEKYPTSKFEVTGVKEDTVMGNLTIKGITHGIKFPAMWNVEGDMLEANAEFTIDRSKWDVKYNSGSFFKDLGDKLIKDEISFKVKLVGEKAMKEAV